MASIDLRGAWKQDVERINSVYIPGQTMNPSAVVPKVTSAPGSNGMSQLSKPPKSLQVPNP